MQIIVTTYRETGKYYGNFRIEIAKMPWEDGILEEVQKKQDFLHKPIKDMYVVLDDIPESQNDPNYRMTYASLYNPEEVNLAAKKAGFIL